MLAWDKREAREERRFAIALCLSLVLHACLLFVWRQQPVLRRAMAEGSLSVSFRAASVPQLAKALPQVSQQQVNVEADRPPRMLSARDGGFRIVEPPPVAIRPPAPIVPRQAAVTSPSGERTDPDSPLRRDGPTPGIPQRTALKHGEVGVILLINEDGHPGQIFWDQLPALTSPQLRQLEIAIRRRTYATAVPGAKLTEVINVFALLRQAEAAAAEAAPGVPSQ